MSQHPADDVTTLRPLRVALALESSGPGGAEHMVVRLGRALRERGHEIAIATLRPGWMTERAESASLPVHIVPQRRGLAPLWIPRFAGLLRRERIDLLHSHEFTMNVYGGAAALLARRPHVATLHSALYVAERRRRALAYRILVRAGLRLVAVSAVLADELAEHLSIERARIAVIPNGVPVPPAVPAPQRPAARRAARERIGLAAAGRLLVAVGNLYAVKDHVTLVRALSRLPADVHAAIAGRGGEKERVRKEAAQLGVSERLHLLGARDDVDRLLLAADLFVHPSRSEGLPLAVLEAMAAGLPVVATRVGGVPEVVLGGVTGLLVEPGSPDALAAAIRSLLEAPERIARLGAAGQARVVEHFSVASMRAGYERLYAEVAGSR